MNGIWGRCPERPLARVTDKAYLNRMDHDPQLQAPPTPGKRRRGFMPMPAFGGAWRDLKQMFTGMDRRRILFLCLSFAITFALLFGFLIDSDFRKLQPGPQLIYAESWPENRSDAEIVAQQKRDAAVKKEQEAERQRQYQRLAKKLGIE